MMLFFTIVFITWFFASLIKGNLYYNLTKESGLEEIKRNENSIEKIGDAQTKMLALVFLIILPMFITEVIYLINAFNIDTLKYPTMFMIVWFILNLVIGKKNSNDLKTSEGREKYKEKLYTMKKRTFKGTMSQLIYLSYFGYMFYMIVFKG